MTAFHEQILMIDGMHCDACVRRVAQALAEVRGARVHSVEVGEAKVLAEPGSEAGLRDAVANAGCTVTEIRGEG